MCSLFGILDYRQKLSVRQRTQLLSALAKESEERGTDATGIAYNTNGRLHIFKRPAAAHTMKFRLPQEACFVMGHTRMATQGNAIFNCNNHPFPGEVGGMDFALAHNGVITNDFLLEQQLRLPKSRIRTDSYVIVQLLERQKELSKKSLADAAERLEGSFTFTVLTAQNTLYFVKGNNPLHLLHWKNPGLYVYASTEEIMEQALSAVRFLPKEYEVLKLRPGEILQIDSDGTCSCGAFSAARLYQTKYVSWGYSPWFGGAKNERRKKDIVKNEQQMYIRELKAVASAYGFSAEDIDRMLANGLTPAEIEEFFFCGM